MHSRKSIARSLATTFVAGTLDEKDLVQRGERVLGRRWRWLLPMARRLAEICAGRVRPRKATIEKWILRDPGFSRACSRHDLCLTSFIGDTPMMRPIAAAKAWDIQLLRTAGELGGWLGLTLGELDWFADLRGLLCKQSSPKLRHYRYRTLSKKHGQFRLIEAPKPRLKEIQRRILTGILDHVPPHEAAHGFRRGRSIVTFAGPHVGSEVVIKLDLEDFFPSISAAQIHAIFRSVGYPEAVADLLTGLCTTSTPMEELHDAYCASYDSRMQQQRRRYSQRHLPQGAPTSPSLANLCAYRMDCRLAGLAAAVGANYTRYADDLVFSGDGGLRRAAVRFSVHASAIIMEEGFSVHHRKTRIMRQGVRQRIAGMVVNQGLNLPREDFDRLKATLTNCARHGAPTQNRSGHENFRSHLEGRVSYFEMITPVKGGRLRELFEQISWS
jgi:RNA-directed DNA polymerase